jgi:hypothetical protein
MIEEIAMEHGLNQPAKFWSPPRPIPSKNQGFVLPKSLPFPMDHEEREGIGKGRKDN